MDDNSLSKNSGMSSVQQRTPTKRRKNNSKKRNNNNNKNNSSNNNKQIKVVYISNPMKVKTSASEFRALVQELTGQDSELPSDPSKYNRSGSSDGDGDGGGSGGESENNKMDCDNFVVKAGDDEEDDYYHDAIVVPPLDPNSKINGEEGKFGGGGDGGVSGGGGGGGGCLMESFEPFDDVFTPQMIENISSFLPSSMFYESPQVDQVVMQCNYVHP